ncbi:MAG: hypothetical protein JRH08_13985 [Deltaproteobacteria bacterium]|nr:hypothetical protein [Deltaproteobacteria bacterium]MBW1927834.1 hypothetical protein [Deltaproteobacteria bacterium]MBW2026508.1 hypothetical protein [Deltaproteobacteria bacterium]MBW2126755.1 hypothetical protein [Deltaproteobacteria bacterium]
MKLYAIIIEPTAGFGTPLKGDTLFGQFCWEAAWDSSLVEGGIDRQLVVYHERPFVIFSSAVPKLKSENEKLVCALRKPALSPPLETFSDSKRRMESLKKRKEEKKRQWVIYEYGSGCIRAGNMRALNDEELFERCQRAEDEIDRASFWGPRRFHLYTTRSHNTINRLSSSTGEPPFAPYNIQVGCYMPGLELVIFILLEESVTDIERVTKGLERMGEFGFGKDASTGMGRFEVKDTKELEIPKRDNAHAFYTLAPCVPEQGRFERYFFTPFVRFGRHGGDLARSENPFKNPVIMADEGAVFIPAEGIDFDRPYIGKAVRNVSKAEPNTVVQGYAPYLPLVMGG